MTFRRLSGHRPARRGFGPNRQPLILVKGDRPSGCDQSIAADAGSRSGFLAAQESSRILPKTSSQCYLSILAAIHSISLLSSSSAVLTLVPALDSAVLWTGVDTQK